MTDTLIPLAQPVPGESDQRPRISNPRFVAQAPIEFTFTGPGVDVAVEHKLGRIPVGYLVVKRTASMTVYDGVASSSEDWLVLRASAAGTAYVLVL